ncbi:MAG: glycosyltransferase family 2 protein [Paludibacteraceae bacterium]|nr:glycosyltransferase family 2 protein [Paludibacteraceae bacterium]
MLKQSVSVVIPMIKENKNITQVIDSVVTSLENSSLVQDKEIIIVSRDALSKQTEFVRENYPNIKIYISNSRASYGEVSNKGLFKATGNIIVLITETTLLPTDYFDVVIPQFEKTNIFAASVVARFPEDGRSTNCYAPIFTSRHVNYKTCEVPSTSYTLTFDRSNVAILREKLIQLGGFNLLFAPDASGDTDLFLRGWMHCWKSCFLTTTHCDLLEPVDSHLVRGATDKIRIEREYNDMLLRKLYLPQRQQPLLMIHNILLFILSIVIPLDIFKPTRMASLKYIKNYNKILSSKRWRYSTFEIDLPLLNQRFF